MLTDLFARQLERGPIAHDRAEAAEWRAAADRLYADWDDDFARSPRRTRSNRAAFERSLVLADTFLSEIAARPPELPCHGVAHTLRVLAHALDIIAVDGLGPLDAARLVVAAAGHDLGRLLLPRDDLLRHADVSAVLFDRIRAAAALPDAVFLPARYAILMHSARRPDRLPITPRVIDDVRSADKYDALNEIGIVRALLYNGSANQVDIRPIIESIDGRAVVLHGWWKNILLPEPVEISPYARGLIDGARNRNGLLGADLGRFRGDPERLIPLFERSVRLVEPDANHAAIARTMTRLAGLPVRSRTNWAGLLEVAIPAIEGLEAHRRTVLARELATGTPERRALASLLMRWQKRLEAIRAESFERRSPAAA